jgi:hypothetical protein
MTANTNYANDPMFSKLSLYEKKKYLAKRAKMTLGEWELDDIQKTLDEQNSRHLKEKAEQNKVDAQKRRKSTFLNKFGRAAFVSCGILAASVFLNSEDLSATLQNVSNYSMPEIIGGVSTMAITAAAASKSIWEAVKYKMVPKQIFRLKHLENQYKKDAQEHEDLMSNEKYYIKHEQNVESDRKYDQLLDKILGNDRNLYVDQRYGFADFDDFKKTNKFLSDRSNSIASKFKQAAQKAKKTVLASKLTSGIATAIAVIAPAVHTTLTTGSITSGLMMATAAGSIAAIGLRDIEGDAFEESVQQIAQTQAEVLAPEAEKMRTYVNSHEEMRKASRLEKEANPEKRHPIVVEREEEKNARIKKARAEYEEKMKDYDEGRANRRMAAIAKAYKTEQSTEEFEREFAEKEARIKRAEEAAKEFNKKQAAASNQAETTEEVKEVATAETPAPKEAAQFEYTEAAKISAPEPEEEKVAEVAATEAPIETEVEEVAAEITEPAQTKEEVASNNEDELIVAETVAANDSNIIPLFGNSQNVPAAQSKPTANNAGSGSATVMQFEEIREKAAYASGLNKATDEDILEKQNQGQLQNVILFSDLARKQIGA